MKTALILGCAGQDGSYLAELLLAKGYRVVGLVSPGCRDLRQTNIAHIADKIETIAGDITDRKFMKWLVRSVMPDEMYNLAAISFVKRSFAHPDEVLKTNGEAVLNMLQTVKRIRDERGHSIRFYQASTSEMFGNAYGHITQNEQTPFNPQSPYAAAKVYAHQMVKIYREAYDLYACSGILFNHESPRRGYEFVTRKITRAVARMKLGLQHSIELGNLEAERDWGFAGDYVEAMHAMLQKDVPEDYTVGTGFTARVIDFYRMAATYAGLDPKLAELFIVQRKDLERPREVYALRANAAAATLNLKWQPKVRLPQLVEMMVDNDLGIEGATCTTR